MTPTYEILHREVLGQHEMQHDYGLVAGTPVRGLDNVSSATHARGGVCGITGWQAARAAIADRR